VTTSGTPGGAGPAAGRGPREAGPPASSQPARDQRETLAGIGEFGLVAALQSRLPQGAGVAVGPGDDAAVVAVTGGRVVVTTDLVVEGRHFRSDWSEPYGVGRRAAARSLADVAAMGGRATAVVVALAAPPTLATAWALSFADGLKDECEPLGASVVGGDVSASERLVLAVTALGNLAETGPVLRSGARPGDLVAVCGRLGWAAAGLAVLSRGFRSPRALVAAYRRPEPVYDAGPEAARLGATALVDVSDGLLADLGHVASASGVDVDLDPAAFAVPDQLRDVGNALGADPMTWVLTGGEDHALAGCFPGDEQLPNRWTVVGQVRPVAGDAPAVTVGGEPWTGSAGHEHFR
jgi:thiamine-monophosphate kinase